MMKNIASWNNFALGMDYLFLDNSIFFLLLINQYCNGNMYRKKTYFYIGTQFSKDLNLQINLNKREQKLSKKANLAKT